MDDTILMTTKEVARYLKVNEKKVYTLITENGLPATKVTGKWTFPKHLVEQWLENTTINYPDPKAPLPPYHGLTIISGSNDILLEQTISLFNRLNPEHIAVFGNLGSMGGIRALGRNLCHMAASHLLQEEDQEYNFDFASRELGQLPAVVNFCRREQGILVARGNPRGIRSVEDLRQTGIRIANRPIGTGTRLLFDQELIRAGIAAESIEGYEQEFQKHLDVGLEILAKRVDAAPCIRAVAGILDLDFIPLRWERFDFLVKKEMFFDQGVQLFLGLLHEPEFQALAAEFSGYDLSLTAKMVFPREPLQPELPISSNPTEENG
jgi:excisionase family DNA binding protein